MKRLKNLSSFIVMDIVKEAAKYPDAIHFEIGQPDIAPSQRVKKAMQKALDKNSFAYTESLGLGVLREKIAAYYKSKYGIDVPKERIIITPGTSGAFLVAYSLALDYNESIGLPDPGYPCYKNFAYILDIKPVFINVFKNSGYKVTTEHLKNLKIKALQISSPANPTGNVYEKNDLKELIGYCEKENIKYISDELYHGLVYEGKEHTALEFSDEIFVINGFSKYFCLPGLRLGWIVVPQRYTKDAEKIVQNLFISPPTLSQYGALEAFDEEYLSKVKKTFKKRRDFLYEALKDIFEIDAKPQGAFYIWADISKYSDDSLSFAKELLENSHTAVTPGLDFGKNETERYIRFAYTTDIEKMKEGVERIKEYLSNRYQSF
ncbi:aminotransferase class I/II-fold pyridoxal phosphate-dependent enzyme [Nitrosophilus alvini]|uniref:aminotransferase class I/II-fold pyridoxal phosphate-dependent enzyme n=1 Tax=Nitrosophilus alvini TaxID=2714855 RepID=UPI00190DDC32|nr:aminotransferase class I/II-fold pyridoxal phosphate-dependent enzyme [Nitrosophilus alvini]